MAETTLPTPEELYVEAERRIEEAGRTGATELDLDFWTERKPEEKDRWTFQQEKPKNFGLRRLPDSLWELTQLQQLDLSDNQLTGLPEAVGQLTQLRGLDLGNNQLTGLPEAVGELKQLELLWLNNNQLTELPVALWELTALESLTVASNYLTSLPVELKALTALKWLNLSNNYLKSLPAELGVLTALIALNVDNNHLTSLPAELGRLTALQMLYISNNQLTTVPAELGRLMALQRLYISNNQLTTVPAELGRLTALHELRLSNNQLMGLPKAVWALHTLYLELENNPLPAELLEEHRKGTARLLPYLRLRQEPLREAKLILIGHGMAGKTTLLGALRDDEWQDQRQYPTPETIGLAIRSVELPHPKGGTPITFNAWDFGGQDWYLDTQQLFFTPDAVYVVVWFPDPVQETGRTLDWSPVKKWVEALRKRVKDAQVLVVITPPRDLPGDAALPYHAGKPHPVERFMRQELGTDTLAGIYYINSKPQAGGRGPRTGIDELKKALAEAATRLPGFDLPVAKKWREARQALRAVGRDCLGLMEVQERLAEAFEMTEADVQQCLSSADALGALVYQDKLVYQERLVIVNPDALARAIGVLQSPQTPVSQGLITEGEVEALWAQHQIPFFRRKAFLPLLARYEVAYPISTRAGEPARLLLPAKLPQEEPPQLAAAWPERLDVGLTELVQECRVFNTSKAKPDTVLGMGLLPRLIVRLHRYSLGRTDYARACHWQQGVVLEDGIYGRALMREVGDSQQTVIRVAVRAIYPATLLDILMREVMELVRENQGLEAVLYVPCRTQPTLGAGCWYDMETLLEELRHGHTDISCGFTGRKCGQRPAIAQLLPHTVVTGGRPPWEELRQEMTAMRQAMDQLQAPMQAILRQVVVTNADVRVSLSDLMKKISQLENKHAAGRQELLDWLGRIDSRVQELLGELKDIGYSGPRNFDIEPLGNPEANWWQKWVGSERQFRVIFFCEHSLQRVGGPNSPVGVYEVSISRHMLADLAPVLRISGFVIQAVASLGLVASGHLPDFVLLHQVAESSKSIGEALEKMEAALPSAEAPSPNQLRDRTKMAVRWLHEQIRAQDPDYLRLGLKRVEGKIDGRYRWVLPEFASHEDYRR